MSIIEVFKDFTWKRTLFLSLVAFVLSFPALDLFVNDDPDGVLALLFNRLVADPNADFGPFIFPHGPLAFLLHPLDTGYNLYFFLSFVFLSKLSVIWSLSYFLEKGSKLYGNSGDLHFRFAEGNITSITTISGYINHEVSNSQMNFTGQHRCIPQEEDLYNNVNDYIGMVVESTGQYNSIFTEEEEYDLFN